MPTTHITHHPDTTVRAPLQHHELTFSQDNLEQAFELYPSQAMSRFGVQNAQQMMIYLRSPEGKLVKSIISEEIAKIARQQRAFSFEQQAELALQRRMLALLAFRYAHDRAARHAHKRQLELEQLLETALLLEDSTHVESMRKDTTMAYEETLAVVEHSLEYEEREMEAYMHQIEEAKELEERLKALFDELYTQVEDLTNAGEAFADVCMAITEEFTEKLQESMDDIEQRIKSLESQQATAPRPKPTPSGQQQTGPIQEVRRLQDQMKMYSDAQQQIRALQQRMRGPLPDEAPHHALRREGNQVLEAFHQHPAGLEKQHHIHNTRLHRLMGERDQLALEQRAVVAGYDKLSQRLRASPQTAEPEPAPSNSPTPFQMRPMNRPRGA